MYRWYLIVLLAAVGLTACAGSQLPASRGYVDQVAADLDVKVRESFDAMDRAVLEAKAAGQEDGPAAVAGIKAGAERAKEDLPQREDGGAWIWAGIAAAFMGLYRLLVGRFPLLGGVAELLKGTAPAQVAKAEKPKTKARKS